MGHNGGPDWRAMIAGEDAKAIEQLSRFQTPQDFLKSHNELRTKLSQRAEPAKLPDNPTPEQIGEWRKGIGLPEVAKDAKPEAYLEAYKVKAPEGYDMDATEKGMLTDYAKLAYEQGHSPREVKAATDFFFQQQAAQRQVLNKVEKDFQKAEQSAWRDEIGTKEYEAQIKAGNAWLKEQIPDDMERARILNARLPDGGLLGDSRWFGELIAKQALGAGFTDLIEANALEAGGKSLAEQHRAIMNLMHTDRAAYNEAQPKLLKIVAARQARGEIDEWGNERKRA